MAARQAPRRESRPWCLRSQDRRPPRRGDWRIAASIIAEELAGEDHALVECSCEARATAILWRFYLEKPRV
jgi:hypothetical protein